MSISIAFAKKTTKLHKNSSLGDCTTPRSVSRYATIFVFEIKSSRISLSRSPLHVMYYSIMILNEI